MRYVFETMTDAEARAFDGSTDTLTFSNPDATEGAVKVQYVETGGSYGFVVTDTADGLSRTFGLNAFPMTATFRSGRLLAGGPDGDSLAIGGGGRAALFGGPGDDALSATRSASAFLQGNTGADTLQGSSGSYTLFGGQGADDISVRGTGARSLVNGNADNDLIDASGSSGANTLFGGQGDDMIIGGTGANLINGNLGNDNIVGHSTSGDWLFGGQGGDQIDARASTGRNLINGNMGSDTVLGGNSGDTLLGGQGDDLIVGGSGDDLLIGDLGVNLITGGLGADTFRNGAGVARDIIGDFNPSQGDRVQIAASLTYRVWQADADVQIDVSNGDVIVLQNTQLSSLGAGWLVQG